MADVTLTPDQDILADSLASNVAAVSGCIDLLGFAGCSLKVCWEVQITTIKVKVVFETPVGDVDLGSGTLTPNNAQIKLGGSKRGFKAEVTVQADFNQRTLKICGKISAPLAGSKEGCTTVEL